VRTAIIASGAAYLRAAGLAAATVRLRSGLDGTIEIWVPRGEDVAAIEPAIGPFELTLRRFDHQPRAPKPVAHLKLGALVAMGDGPLLVLDADVCCQRPVELPALLAGQVAGVRDRRDGSPRVGDPWHVPGVRPYVNSGVLLWGPQTIDLRASLLDFADDPGLLGGPFEDQRVLNYALQGTFADRLVLLPPTLNAIRWRWPRRAVLRHFAGGAGRYAERRGGGRHARACRRIVRIHGDAEQRRCLGTA